MTIFLLTLALHMLGVPLTHVVRMGIAPAAGPKSPFPGPLPEQVPTHFGLGCGVVRLGLSYAWCA